MPPRCPSDGGLVAAGAKLLCRIKGILHGSAIGQINWLIECSLGTWHSAPYISHPILDDLFALKIEEAFIPVSPPECSKITLRGCLMSRRFGQRGDLRAYRRASWIQAGSGWSSDWDVLTLLSKPRWQSLHKVQPLGLTDHISLLHFFFWRMYAHLLRPPFLPLFEEDNLHPAIHPSIHPYQEFICSSDDRFSVWAALCTVLHLKAMGVIICHWYSQYHISLFQTFFLVLLKFNSIGCINLDIMTHERDIYEATASRR